MIHGLAATGVTIFATTHYLDEAKHAGRGAMIQTGTLAALDMPADFKGHFLRGRLAVRRAEMLRAIEVLRQQSDISDVSLYGDTVHALLQHGDEASMARALTEAGILEATIEPIEPSLEDVFISLMKRHRTATSASSPRRPHAACRACRAR